MRTSRVLVIAIAAVVIAACGGGDDAPAAAPASGAISVEAGDLYYEPTSLTAAAGEIQITIENTGAVEHDVVIEEAGDVEVVHAEAGETVTGTVTLEAGTYTFYCAIPGHRAAGMEGTLTVQ
ncbi:MAG: plastocyanin/azurin family copper-binding protein [Nitriliruptoraceae bacterium]